MLRVIYNLVGEIRQMQVKKNKEKDGSCVLVIQRRKKIPVQTQKCFMNGSRWSAIIMITTAGKEERKRKQHDSSIGTKHRAGSYRK